MSDATEEIEQEVDPLEDLKDELTTLQSDVVFNAFVTVGLKYIGFAQGKDGLELHYDKTKHLAVFQALSESWDDFSETLSQQQEKNP